MEYENLVPSDSSHVGQDAQGAPKPAVIVYTEIHLHIAKRGEQRRRSGPNVPNGTYHPAFDSAVVRICHSNDIPRLGGAVLAEYEYCPSSLAITFYPREQFQCRVILGLSPTKSKSRSVEI
jgi:hypothetical protein